MHYHFTYVYILKAKILLLILIQAFKSTLIHHHPIYRLHSKFYNFHKNVLSSLLSWDPIEENAYHVVFFSSYLAVSRFFPTFLSLAVLKTQATHFVGWPLFFLITLTAQWFSPGTNLFPRGDLACLEKFLDY